MRIIVGIDPGPHCGLVVLEKNDEGWVVMLRWTFEMADAPKGDTHCHWARETARMLTEPALQAWFNKADVIVTERQYVQGQPLPSFLIMECILGICEYAWPNKTRLVGSNEVKAAYFSEAQRKNYAKRKQVAELLTKNDLEKAQFFNPAHRLHDQADAFLVACYFIQHVLKRAPVKQSAGFRRKALPTQQNPVQDDTPYEPRKTRSQLKVAKVKK